MPIREYECTKCGQVREVIESVSAKTNKTLKCNCGKKLKLIDFSKSSFKVKRYSLIDGNGKKFA